MDQEWAVRVWRARAREVLGVVGVDGEEGGEGSVCGEESGSAGVGNGNGKVGLGPLVGTVRWFRTREWVPFSGGWEASRWTSTTNRTTLHAGIDAEAEADAFRGDDPLGVKYKMPPTIGTCLFVWYLPRAYI